MTIYPKDSIGITCPIKVNGVIITTAYGVGAQMTNPAPTYGIAKFTAYKPDGTIALDSAGVTLQDIAMNALAANGGTAVYTIATGFPIPGIYEIHPYFKINDVGSNLVWEKQTVIRVTVVALAQSAL